MDGNTEAASFKDFGCSDDKFSHKGLLASDGRVRQEQLTGRYCVIAWEIGEWCEAGGADLGRCGGEWVTKWIGRVVEADLPLSSCMIACRSVESPPQGA